MPTAPTAANAKLRMIVIRKQRPALPYGCTIALPGHSAHRFSRGGNFLITSTGREKSRAPPSCSRARFFPNVHIQTSPVFGNAGGGDALRASRFLISFQRSKSFSIRHRGGHHSTRCVGDESAIPMRAAAGNEFANRSQNFWATDWQSGGGSGVRG